MELSSVCVVDATGKIIREAKVASEPEALVRFFGELGFPVLRIGLEAGPLSQWLHAGLSQAGYEAVLLETRHVKAALSAMAERIAAHVFAGTKLHADDTPVPVLAPGAGKTRTGRLWVYARDDRASADTAPPAVLYRYTPDRKGEHPQRQLAGWRGALQADGYAGFNALYETKGADPPAISEVACWAHVRRKFFDVHQAHKGAAAKEVLERIGRLYAVEERVRGQPAARRAAARQAEAKPEIIALRTHLEQLLGQVSGKSALAEAIRYALSRWPALTRYLADGRLEIDNNIAERAMRAVALGRKNWLFAGSDGGGEAAAVFYTLIETAKSNGHNPRLWLTRVLETFGRDRDLTDFDALLPWSMAPEPAAA